MAETTGTAKTIDQLPTKSNILETDYFPIDDGAQSYKVTWGELLKKTGGIKSVETTDNSIVMTMNDGTTITITTSDPNKQDKLTWDTTPTSNSTNPVTSGGIYLAINAVKSDVADNSAAIDANASEIQVNKTAITLLNSDKTTEGSVAYQVTQAIAELIADAPASLDTLKEIADWITQHSDDAAAMNTQILANKKNIEAEVTRAEAAETANANAISALGLEVVNGCLCAVYEE